jgi:fatty-acid desaturase
MRPVHRLDTTGADPCRGRVVWAPAKSLWYGAMLLGWLALAPTYTTIGAVAFFVVSTYMSLLHGHSIGLHRGFIHRSFDAAKWLERLLVYVGVLVGMAGPFGILRIHDYRDWAQRQRDCHDFFAHRRAPLVDLFWQLTARFEFERPPHFRIDEDFASDPFYRFLERTWMLQQLPLALVLYAIGGTPWVVWGICARVATSVIGHWSVTYWCHRPGAGAWRVHGASVQAANLEGLGWLTYGECWHNNHHAFPESARIGLEPGQADPGWRVLCAFRRLGWVHRLGEPRPAEEREDLEPIADAPNAAHVSGARKRIGRSGPRTVALPRGRESARRPRA